MSDIQIQKYKYTNTVKVKVADRPYMCYIFEKAMVRGPQKQCSRVCDKQIHKYNYTNIQIQFGSNLQIIDLTCAIFLKRSWYEDLKNNVPDCLTYNYTNTQIEFGLKVIKSII